MLVILARRLAQAGLVLLLVALINPLFILHPLWFACAAASMSLLGFDLFCITVFSCSCHCSLYCCKKRVFFTTRDRRVHPLT